MIQQHNPLMIDGRSAKLAYSSTRSSKPEVPLEGAQLLAQQYFDRTYSWGQQGNEVSPYSYVSRKPTRFTSTCLTTS
jgi:hypothetical protein